MKSLGVRITKNNKFPLIQELQQVPHEDLPMENFQHEINYHTPHTIIANFLGTKLPTHFVVDWVVLMNNAMKFEVVNFQMDESTCFMYLNSFVPKGTKKLLMVTPHMTPWNMGIYQEWVLMFNLDFPHGLKILFWCSLKVLPFEYRPIDKTMSVRVGKIMGKDPNNHKRWDGTLGFA